MLTVRKIQLVVIRDALQQVPGPFETEFGILVQQLVRLVGSAQAMAKLHVGTRPAGVYVVFMIDSHQQAGAEQGHQRRGLQLVFGVLDVTSDLSWGLSAPAFHAQVAGITKVGRIELTNAVVGEPRCFQIGFGDPPLTQLAVIVSSRMCDYAKGGV